MEYGHLDTPYWKRFVIALVFRAMSSERLANVCHCNGGILMVSRLCIKSTRRTDLSEAHTMDFVRRNTSIPVPKVYYAFERKGRVYIIMQKIQATNAASDWQHRSDESRQRILRQLKTMVEELRTLQVPTGTGVANIDRGPILDHRLPRHSRWGPFSCIRDFHQALVDNQDLTAVVDKTFPDLQELALFHRQPWPQPVFTHGDLSSLNILCKGDKVVGIVDWETAGWLPPYWEYITAWNVNPQNSFWQAEVDDFLTPWPHARKMDTVRRKHFGFY